MAAYLPRIGWVGHVDHLQLASVTRRILPRLREADVVACYREVNAPPARITAARPLWAEWIRDVY